MTALPTITATAAAPRIDRATYERLARRARLLSWLSLAWMTAEGAVAISAGVMASSIALVGFGLDSAIEGLASMVIVWRFSLSRMFSPAAETRAQKLVAVQFFLLAPYVAVESMRALIGGERPDETWVGIALAGRPRRRARAARTCSAPTSPARCSSAWSAMRWWVPGGSTRALGC
jgi:hypothetical protein